jgi:TolB protein
MTIVPVLVSLLLESDGNIFTITLDGADKTYLTFDGNSDSLNLLASWSSDGSKIVYTNVKSTDPPASGGVVLQTGHIWTMNADGSDQRELTFGPTYGSVPDFSPEGKSILFTGFATGNPELWLMNSDGTDPRPITHTTASELAIDGTTIKWSTHGTFSPDGTKIAYSSTQTV